MEAEVREIEDIERALTTVDRKVQVFVCKVRVWLSKMAATPSERQLGTRDLSCPTTTEIGSYKQQEQAVRESTHQHADSGLLRCQEQSRLCCPSHSSACNGEEGGSGN